MSPIDPNEETKDLDDPSLNQEGAGDSSRDEDGSREVSPQEMSDTAEELGETMEFSSPSERSTTEIETDKTGATRVVAGRGSRSDGDKQSDTGQSEMASRESNDQDQSRVIRPFGIGEEKDESDKTIPNVEATINMDTIELRPKSHQTAVEPAEGSSKSVMQSADVSQTIDPRALSKEDAAFWGSAAIGASKANQSEQSKLKPAIERSISETKLQIRERDLAVPTQDRTVPSDYRLVSLLGRGGMGNVYIARQSSLDRMIAVKVIKPLPKSKRKTLRESGRLESVEHERRQQFLSEAVVTGDLDHPNIVPIHDIAVAADNTLFYAMKRVVGKPWSKTIDEMSRDENLEVLLKVCDAIAFAHTRGVIHRDIKPENIMLGNFGEVLVMDWGLAIAKPDFEKRDSITFNAGLGGTPAFMAPEMALGPVDSIGPPSDIYLLGATLYYIVVGHAPHKAANVSQCIRAVASNEIQEAPEEVRGELLDVALKAMSTDPSDRHASVTDFQKAIRAYRSHAESIALSTAAEKQYELAKDNRNYESFSRATHGFEQAIALWSDNKDATDSLETCRIDHATAAYENGDLDLGLSLLDARDPRHHLLIDQLKEGLEQRELRASRLKLFRLVTAVSLLVIIVGGTVMLIAIDAQRREADNQRKIAVAERQNAVDQKLIAEEQRAEAEEQRVEAEEATKVARLERDRAEKAEKAAEDNLAEVERQKEAVVEQKKATEKNLARAVVAEGMAREKAAEATEQRNLARASEQVALDALAKAQYESYMSRIGLAKARIDANEFDGARSILTGLRNDIRLGRPAWEWGYLWKQANQSRSAVRLERGILKMAAARSEPFVIAVCDDGSIQRVELGGKPIRPWNNYDLSATCVVLDREDELVIAGTRDGSIALIDAVTGRLIRKWIGHDSSVNDLLLLQDGRLLTASSDRSIRLWGDGPSGNRFRGDPLSSIGEFKPTGECWHIGSVVGIDATESTDFDRVTVIAAVSDAKTGRVVGWELTPDGFTELGVYSQHEAPVRSVAIRRDGSLVASGDALGNVHLWSADQFRRTDYQGAIKSAVARIRDRVQSPEELANDRDERNVATREWRAHPDDVYALEFDRGGRRLLTASDDYTVSVWDVADMSREFSLRGHGGWVRTLAIRSDARDQQTVYLTGSVDGTIRTWNPPTSDVAIVAPVVEQTDSSMEDAARESQLHNDEILAARLDQTGSRLISASRDHTARVLGIDRKALTFRPISNIDPRSAAEELNEGTEFLAMSAAVDAGGKRLFVGSADSTIRVWDLASGIQVSSITGTGLNTSLAISAAGDRLVSGSSNADAKAIVWDFDPERGVARVRHQFRGHQQAVSALAMSRDGSLVVTGDRGGRCIVWDADQGRSLGEPIDAFRGFRINQLAVSADNQSIWVASDGGALTQIDLSSRESRRRLEHDGFVIDFSVDANQQRIVTLASETTEEAFATAAFLWTLDGSPKKELQRIEAKLDRDGRASVNAARITSVDFSGSSGEIVICRQESNGQTGSVTIVSPGGSKQSFRLPNQIGAPEAGLMIGDEQLITLNGEAAFRWSVDQMIHEKSYRPHASVIEARFSPDGEIAVTASRSLRLWRADVGTALDKLENPHAATLTSMDTTKDPNSEAYLFATSANANSAKLWSWDATNRFRAIREIGGRGSTVEHVRFSPDAKSILLTHRDGTVRIHRVDNGSVVREWSMGAGTHATCVEFSASGRYVAMGTSDKSAMLFDLSPEEASGNGTGKTSLVRSVMQGHADRIEAICVLDAAERDLRVFTASRDKSVRVWDPYPDSADPLEEANRLETPASVGREILILRQHTRGVTAVDCTSDGSIVVTAGRDGKVLIWPTEFGE